MVKQNLHSELLEDLYLQKKTGIGAHNNEVAPEVPNPEQTNQEQVNQDQINPELPKQENNEKVQNSDEVKNKGQILPAKEESKQ